MLVEAPALLSRVVSRENTAVEARDNHIRAG